ncbi:hypothetical protein C8F04DRAFT_646843 [Mycena alexandri]|uniref:Uncharacterized protein n=1 Tax=Mycena alexandri TaxID=1745969 RepID=A0AAD6SRP9_9AGAR|nr:hypothetical protein C8F04DRAFT_646843 [Mycena alexandri]
MIWSLMSLDRKIDAFTPILPSTHSKSMLVVHMLCHGATIQLHHYLAKERVDSRTKNLAAARAIVDILAQTDIAKVGLIDPVLAPLWTSACLAFISEIEHQRREAEVVSVESLKQSVKSVIAAMEAFASQCRLMTAQLDAVRKAYAGAVEEE